MHSLCGIVQLGVTALSFDHDVMLYYPVEAQVIEGSCYVDSEAGHAQASHGRSVEQWHALGLAF